MKLVVAKCWDASPRGYFLPPHSDEPVRPIDPSAWVAHTEAVLQEGGFAGQTSGFIAPSFGLMPSFGQSSSLDASPLSSVVSSHETCTLYKLHHCVILMYCVVCTFIIQRHSVVKSVGCFQWHPFVCGFVCVFVCQYDNF